MPLLSSLEELSLFKTNIDTLEGIGRFRLLKKVSLFRAGQLQQIDDVRALKNTLVSIEFDQCKKIVSYEPLGELENLLRLVLFRCHAIESLHFIKRLERLEFLSFVGTDVLDGNLSPAFGITYVGFNDKSHYSHSFKDFSARGWNICLLDGEPAPKVIWPVNESSIIVSTAACWARIIPLSAARKEIW